MKIDKKTVKISGLILLAFLIGVGVTLKMGGTPEQPTNTREKKSATTWTCAMHPQIKLPKPGKCPICGMTLVPVASSGGGSNRTADFTMSKYATALAQVVTAPVRLANPRYSGSFLGELDWNERTVKAQSAWFGGRIEKLYISYIGQAVRRGAAVAMIYSPELFSAAEEWRQVKNSDNERLKKSVNRKLILLGLNENDIKKLASVKSEYFIQRASVSGVVTKLTTYEGSYVKRGGALVTVAQTAKLWTQIELYEKDLNIVAVGDSVTISIPNSFTTVTGRIVFIDPVVNPQKRTSRARIEIENREGLLKPGMLVEATIEKEIDGKQLLVPATALLFTGKRAVLYVSKNGGYELRDVLVGKRYGNEYVVEGVAVGENVVSRGAFKIDAARQIMALPSMMYPKGGGPDPMAGMNHGKSNMNMKKQKKSAVKASENSLTTKEKSWLNSIYPDYLALQKALRSDDTKNALVATKKMMKILMSPPKKLATDKESSVMMALHKINDKSDIKAIRAYFLLLSNWMITTFEQYSLTPKTGGSVFFCPMSNNNKGAEWIQRESEVLNPYLGTAMIGCGEVRRPVGVKIGANNGK